MITLSKGFYYVGTAVLGLCSGIASNIDTNLTVLLVIGLALHILSRITIIDKW